MDFNFPRPMLNSPTKDDAVGNAFYARVVHRVDAWRDDDKILNTVLAEIQIQEMPTHHEQLMRHTIYCTCSTCRNTH